MNTHISLSFNNFTVNNIHFLTGIKPGKPLFHVFGVDDKLLGTFGSCRWVVNHAHLLILFLNNAPYFGFVCPQVKRVSLGRKFAL